MATRIDAALAAVREQQRTGLVTFVTAGDPDLRRSREVLLGLDRGGSDVIEVGVPFSDPVADGPVIQRASERALAGGTTLDLVLELCADVRPLLRAPIVLFSYLNPILRLGLTQFVERAARSGIDGLLVVDLPIEESARLRDASREAGLDQILLVSPTTSQQRLRQAASVGSGFLYAISTLGVTGVRAAVADEARALLSRIRQETAMAVAVGFGISHPDQVREVGGFADAAVVGSSIVDLVGRRAGCDDIGAEVAAHVRWLLGQGDTGSIA